jgi:hypothetical protein
LILIPRIKERLEVGMVGKKVGEELIGRFILKIKTRGHAYCELCNKDISFAALSIYLFAEKYVFLG